MATSNPPVGPAAPKEQLPGHPSFRRQRASRACETCHARKVRCDAASLGVPCTNCEAFSIECKIPAPKRKKSGAHKKEGADASNGAAPQPPQQQQQPLMGGPYGLQSEHGFASESPTDARRDTFSSRDSVMMNRAETIGMNTPAGMPPTELSDAYESNQRVNNSTYSQYMKPKFARAPIKEAGRVAYLGESSNLSLLVQDRHGTTDVVHYPLPENVRGTRARVDDLDDVEINILHQRGAFLLPPRALCDELVDAYFQWVAPVVPVINRSKFMRRYRDSKDPPSLLLLQAILLAGSRVCSNPQLMDSNGSTTPAAMTFYKRAKALYDANFEDDRVTIVQALILMGWYWEGPEDVTKNVFYWSRVAVIVAQGSGMHRSVEGSQLSKADKRLWKRIWWTLFTRDRSVAVALGRPCCINIEDSDVEMISEDDFIDDEPDRTAEYPADPIHVQFFLNYVKLCEIMGLVLSQQYSVASKARRTNAIDLTHSDMALADWLQNCPPEVTWEPQRHHFWSALLHSNYYTTLCLLHRAHMPPAGSSHSRSNGYPEEVAYPSRTIAYQAAGMITSITQALEVHDQLRYTPAFIVYSLFSALIMHVYQMRSSNQEVISATQQRLRICMNALRDVSKVWLVAKMVHTLFESILGNKVLEERLQKAAGRKHANARANGASHHGAAHNKNGAAKETTTADHTHIPAVSGAEAPKRKFAEMEVSFSDGPPAPQMSYERSRPQSPVLSPSREAAPQTSGPPIPNISTTSPPNRANNDPFPGPPSRSNTRPATPFNSIYSIPGTPPDFFLHTRTSPIISPNLWQNYQPDQLFPPEANGLFSIESPSLTLVDPVLRGPAQQQPASSGQSFGQGMGPPQAQMGVMNYQSDSGSWTQFQNMQQQSPHQPQQDDQWSNSSSTGPIVPTTLNVGDWFDFFGIPNNAGLDSLGTTAGYG